MLRDVLTQNLALIGNAEPAPVVSTLATAAERAAVAAAAPVSRARPRRAARTGLGVLVTLFLLLPLPSGVQQPVDAGGTRVVAGGAPRPLEVAAAPPWSVALHPAAPFAAPAPLSAGFGTAHDETRWSSHDPLSLREAARLPVATLFGLTFRTLVIDPGHGGQDPGAVGPQGVTEKNLVLDLAQRLRARLLRQDGYRVLLTREQDVKMTLKQRVAFANAARADLFISLHFNTLPQEHVNLVETYYFGAEFDRAAAALAIKENRGSAFSASDFRQVLARAGDTLKLQESRALAHALHPALVAAVGAHDAGVIDAGIKTGPFMVLLGLDAPSVLVEISCLSHAAEEQRLTDPAYREQLAAALEAGLLRYLDAPPVVAPFASDTEWASGAFYSIR